MQCLMKFQIMRRKFLSYMALDMTQKILIAEAFLLIILAWLWLKIRPFPSIAKKLGTASSPSKHIAVTQNAKGALSVYEIEAIRKISRAIISIAGNMPLVATCLPQALAGMWMLRRRRLSSSLYLGIWSGDEARADQFAHAWLSAYDMPICGYPIGPRLIEVARFDHNLNATIR